MIPGMNPKQMKQAMKKMGISQQEIDAEEVIIRTADKEIIILEPQVLKMNMMGQDNFQISGRIEERALSSVPEISDEDVKTVAEQANVSLDDAKEAIEKHEGDLAGAIMELQGK